MMPIKNRQTTIYSKFTKLVCTLILFVVISMTKVDAEIVNVGDTEDFSIRQVTEYTIPQSGYYKIEAWGAAGGSKCC